MLLMIKCGVYSPKCSRAYDLLYFVSKAYMVLSTEYWKPSFLLLGSLSTPLTGPRSASATRTSSRSWAATQYRFWVWSCICFPKIEDKSSHSFQLLPLTRLEHLREFPDCLASTHREIGETAPSLAARLRFEVKLSRVRSSCFDVVHMFGRGWFAIS